MLLIRPARQSDMGDLMGLSHAVGTGMTSMPANEGAWLEKLTRSEASFKSPANGPTGEIYFMVLEDTKTRKVVGTTAIYAGVGLKYPFYSYKVSTIVSASGELDTTRKMRILYLVNDYTGSTEIGSLYLSADYRQPGVGQFLSRCRYLTLADFPDRFGDTVIAEMRGWQDKEGRSPFWNHLGGKFFGIAFENADKISSVKGTQIISDLMPKYPIYIDLLPEEAQNVIGKPHDSSSPALRLLEKEGFSFKGYVDVFDGGPSVEVPVQNIKTLQASRIASFAGVEELAPADDQSNLYILSNGNIAAYRMCLQPARLDEEGQIHLTQETVEALRLNKGDKIRCVKFRENRA
ncbi:arginine N-succinyltransferase [Kiloniella laminariae]|uniref:arginine N-succinyltransferase n=1 Tax=Kiloniella laminariae TaxID=454162 RepID=UPI000364759E|nr:arginine N-succinyltransferase [Kiloniella laminariae]